MSVSIVSAVQADRSQLTLRVEALPPGNFPTKWVSLARSNGTVHAEVQITGTHTLNLSTNSKVGSGTESRPWTVCRRQSCGSSSNLREHSNSYLGVMSAPEWQQHQTVYALIDEVSLLDSSGAGLGNRDSNVVVAGQVIVPHGAVTSSAEEASTDDHHCDLARCVRGACRGKYFFGFSRRLRDWVGSYYCCPRRRSVDLHFLSRTIGVGNVPSCVQPRCAPPEFHWSCCMGQTSQHQRVCRHLKEPLENLLITHFDSRNGVHGDCALCFTEGVVASTDWSKMIGVIAHSLGGAIPFGRKEQSPRASTWAILVRKSTNQLGFREQRSRRCGRRRPSGLGEALFCTMESEFGMCQTN